MSMILDSVCWHNTLYTSIYTSSLALWSASNASRCKWHDREHVQSSKDQYYHGIRPFYAWPHHSTHHYSDERSLARLFTEMEWYDMIRMFRGLIKATKYCFNTLRKLCLAVLFNLFERFSRLVKSFQGFSRLFNAFQPFWTFFNALQRFSTVFNAVQHFPTFLNRFSTLSNFPTFLNRFSTFFNLFACFSRLCKAF